MISGSQKRCKARLADISDQRYPVIGAKPCQEFPHLVGAGKARFIHEIEVLSLPRRIGWDCAGKETLQSARFNAGLPKVPRGTRSRREALNFVALHLDGAAYRGQGGGFAGSRVADDEKVLVFGVPWDARWELRIVGRDADARAFDGLVKGLCIDQDRAFEVASIA